MKLIQYLALIDRYQLIAGCQETETRDRYKYCLLELSFQKRRRRVREMNEIREFLEAMEVMNATWETFDVLEDQDGE